MPVETPHPDYSFWAPVWRKLRIWIDEGEAGIKAVRREPLPLRSELNDLVSREVTLGAAASSSRIASTGSTATEWDTLDRQFLPPISAEMAKNDGGEYDRFKRDAPVDNFVARTVHAHVGTLFRETPQVEGVPDDYQANIDLRGGSVHEFAKCLAMDIETVGRAIAGVEKSAGDDGPAVGLERPGARGGEMRSRLVRWPAESCYHWQERQFGGETHTSQLRFMLAKEVGEGFDEAIQHRLRVLDLDGKRRYRVREWFRDEESGDYVPDLDFGGRDGAPAGEVWPGKQGDRWPEIPYVVLGRRLGVAVDTSPNLDLFYQNLHHYRMGAKLQHCLRDTSAVTMWVKSDDPKLTEFVRGGDRAWPLNLGDDVGLLEASGSAIAPLQKEREMSENRMVALGGRQLEQAKREAETAEALRLRQAGDAALLFVIADTISQAMTFLLRRMLWWDGVAEWAQARYSIVKEFGEPEFTLADLAAAATLVGVGLSLKDIHWRANRAGLLHPDHADFARYVTALGLSLETIPGMEKAA